MGASSGSSLSWPQAERRRRGLRLVPAGTSDWCPIRAYRSAITAAVYSSWRFLRLASQQRGLGGRRRGPGF